MTFQSKMVQYQWTDEGEVELCKIEEIMLQKEESCYHCDRKMEKGEKALILFPQDGDKYIICQTCSEKACKFV